MSIIKLIIKYIFIVNIIHFNIIHFQPGQVKLV